MKIVHLFWRMCNVGVLPVRHPGSGPLEAALSGHVPRGRGRAPLSRAPAAAGATLGGGSAASPVLLPAVTLALRRVVDVPLGTLHREPGGTRPSTGRGLRQSTVKASLKAKPPRLQRQILPPRR